MSIMDVIADKAKIMSANNVIIAENMQKVYDAGAKIEKTSEKAKTLSLEKTSTDKIKSLTIYGETPSVENPCILFYLKNMIAVDDFSATGSGVGKVVVPFIIENVFDENEQYTLSMNVYSEGITYSESGNLLYTQIAYTDGYNEYVGITDANYQNGKISIITQPNKTVKRILNFNAQARWTGGTIIVSNVQLEKGNAPTEYSDTKPKFAKVSYTIGVADRIYLESNKVIAVISGVETDITDTESGQQLMALHTLGGTTNVICTTNCQITYVADRTLIGIIEERERILGGAW